MPFIQVKSNARVLPQQEKEMNQEMGKALSIIGKGAEWMMFEVTDQCRITFREDGKTPLCFVHVSLCGTASSSSLNELTKEICRITEKVLGVSPDRTYVQYTQTPDWGWNGCNF